VFVWLEAVIEDNILFFRYLRFPVVLISLLFFSMANAFAGDAANENHKWFLTVYGGPSAQPDLEHVLMFDMDFEDDTYIAVAALAREFWRYDKWISFEVEGQVGKYFGQEHQWQFTGLIIGRWNLFPWDKYVDTSFAVGDGLSYNTEISEIEKEDDENAGKWLNYLLFEVTLGLPKYPRWDFAYRIHHRSSIRERIGAGASNFVTFGVKYNF
jgi:hypothetical protein